MGDQVVVLLVNDSISAVLMVRDKTLAELQQEVLTRWGSRMFANANVQIVVANVMDVRSVRPEFTQFGSIANGGMARYKE